MPQDSSDRFLGNAIAKHHGSCIMTQQGCSANPLVKWNIRFGKGTADDAVNGRMTTQRAVWREASDEHLFIMGLGAFMKNVA